MKYTIEELRKLQPIVKTDEERLAQNTITDLLAEKDKAQQDYNAAIEAANYEAIAHAKSTENIIDELIKTQKTRIAAAEKKREAAYSREDIKNAWNEHITGINADFEAKFAKYKEARKEMAKLFLELAEIQRQAINDVIHVNGLYDSESTGSLQDCNADLVKPALLDSYPETKTKRMTYQEFFGTPNVAAGVVKVPYTEDFIIKALIASGEIDPEKEQDLVSIVDLLQAESNPIN